MTVRKNRIRLVGALLVLVLSLSLVGCAVREGSADDGRLRVVTTLFPYYDFARAIAGGRADVTLLLAPGREAHSFEPTPLDAVTISRADVFIYNGGEGEVWADDMLDAVGEDIGTVLRMMDFVDAREEEFSEGMQGADSHDHAHDHDHERARAAALFLAADVQPCAVGNSRAGLADVCAGLSARAVGV